MNNVSRISCPIRQATCARDVSRCIHPIYDIPGQNNIIRCRLIIIIVRYRRHGSNYTSVEWFLYFCLLFVHNTSMMCSIYWLTYALTHSEQRKQLFYINAGHNFV